jgi:class 3 adenylate cyclase
MSRICTLTLRNNILSDILPRHVMDAVEQQERASVSLSGVGRSGGQAITPGALTTPTTTSATPVTSMSSPNATFPADLTFAANAVGTGTGTGAFHPEAASSAASSSDPLAPSAASSRRNYAGGTRSLDANAAFSVNRPAWASISSRSFEASAAGHAQRQPPPGHPIGPPGHLPPQKQASGLLSRSQAAMSPSFIMDNTAKSHEMVTMLFVDVVGFTSMADRSSPQDVMTFLNTLFGRLDEALLAPSHHLVRKVETAGDCYIAAAGAVRPDGLPWGRMSPRMAVACASQVLDFARDVLRVAADVPMPNTSASTPVRVGVHSGPCVSGSIGRILPKFSIFGDTINVTSRMESTAPHGRIQLSAATHALLTDDPRFAGQFVPGPLGGIDIKGKGRMDTYLLSFNLFSV